MGSAIFGFGLGPSFDPGFDFSFDLGLDFSFDPGFDLSFDPGSNFDLDFGAPSDSGAPRFLLSGCPLAPGFFGLQKGPHTLSDGVTIFKSVLFKSVTRFKSVTLSKGATLCSAAAFSNTATFSNTAPFSEYGTHFCRGRRFSGSVTRDARP